MSDSIGIISYDAPHLKTEQILTTMLQQGLKPVVCLLPFKARKPRPSLFQHRPCQSCAVHPVTIAQAHNLKYLYCEDDTNIPNDLNSYVIGGAGILSPSCVKGKKILNAHPGVIPAARGLDAFKWSIVNKIPMGVTLHTIDAEVDKGDVLSIRKTCVYSTDTLETLARRHYENEIDMLGRYMDFLQSPIVDFKNIIEGAAHMRMPLDIEEQLSTRFEEYKNIFATDKES